jgi:galactonate dehydratase
VSGYILGRDGPRRIGRMKITDVKVYPVRPDLPTSPGALQVGWVFVQVETDEGITGLGECTNWPRKGNILVAQAVQTIKESLIGQDPSHIERIWRELYRSYTYLGSRGLITAVISGIDIALWDIKGKALGRPIYDLLGGPVRDGLLLYTHPESGTPEVVAESARQQVEEGYTAVKTDPFVNEMGKYLTGYMNGSLSKAGERRGAEIIAALRDAVGPDVEVLIDLHGNFDVASAIRCAKALEPFDIGWLEEPVPPESYDALRQVREAVNVPVCVGERLYTRWDFLPVLQGGLADYLMADVCWTGGISELKRISTLAETYYVNMSPHGAMGPVQIFAGAHTMMTVPNFYRLEIMSRWTDAFNAAIDSPLDIRHGSLHISDRPGLGVELDMDFVRAFPDPDWA